MNFFSHWLPSYRRPDDQIQYEISLLIISAPHKTPVTSSIKQVQYVAEITCFSGQTECVDGSTLN
jgi:hypothetical protein